MSNKKTIELKFTGDTTNEAYIDDCAACRILCPDDVAFEGKNVNVQLAVLENGPWYDNYDRLGDPEPVFLGQLRGVHIDLSAFADMPYIRFKATDSSLNGKSVILSFIEVR
jgi:hypothetical protein